MVIIIAVSVAICTRFKIVKDDTQDGGLNAIEEFAGSDEVGELCFACARDDENAVDEFGHNERVADDGDWRRIDDNEIVTGAKVFEKAWEVLALEEFCGRLRNRAAGEEV